jgi:hypothetical protein
VNFEATRAQPVARYLSRSASTAFLSHARHVIFPSILTHRRPMFRVLQKASAPVSRETPQAEEQVTGRHGAVKVPVSRFL